MTIEHIFPDLSSRLALQVLTDRDWSLGRSTLAVAEAAIDGGATTIQLRDKDVDIRTLIEEGKALRKLTQQRNVLLIVNDRVDVALAIEADGVHVGQNDMPGELARKLIGPDRILGISAGSMDEAVAAAAAGADYLGVGPIFATRGKADAGAPVGLGLLTELKRRYTTPLIAIGGITAENAGTVIRAGASGIAVITAVVNAVDVTEATRVLAHAITV
jgi:thiamine-phosphate pyrophosphorylase